MPKDTILVTGGAGFIGSCFVARSVAHGLNVIVLDKLTYAADRSNLEWIKPAGSGKWRLVVGDIADLPLVSKLLREHQVRRVVNFAAESHVDNSIAGPKPFIDTNVMGVFVLLEACRDYWSSLDGGKDDFRFLQVSTDEVYGSLGATGKFNETSPAQPNSPYSASKAAGDHLVRAWHHTYGLPVITTHCTNNYGPRQHPEKLIPHMIHCALSGRKLPVYGDGRNVRDWIHVEDHCEGVWLALTKGKPGETYDFGGEAEVENLTLVKRLCALLDEKRPKPSGSYADQIAFVTDRLGHDRRYAIDDSKAQRQLGYAKRYTLAEGLESTVEWYLANDEWRNMMMAKL